MSNPVAFQTLLEINEPKIQSSSQAGPEVNRDLEVLFETVVKMLRGVQGMAQAVSVLTGGSSGGNTGSTTPPPTGGGTATLPTTEASATTLAGTGQPEATEDAWTAIPSGVPSGASMVLVEGRMWSTNDDAGGTVEVRTESGKQEILLAVVRADGTSDADRETNGWYPLPIDASGNIQYRANTTSGTLGWSVSRLGYW